MALISCPECQHTVSDKALACPSCGYPLKAAAMLSNRNVTSSKYADMTFAQIYAGVGMILLMIYTGFRISAFRPLQYNKAEQYLQGGVKNSAGKNRIVPIHPAIRSFAEDFFTRFCAESGETFQPKKYRSEFYGTLAALNLAFSESGTKHTPHDCRHTFSWLCDKYNVNDLSKHLLMGHSPGGDVERSVYGHRTLDELRAEINKIEIPYL